MVPDSTRRVGDELPSFQSRHRQDVRGIRSEKPVRIS